MNDLKQLALINETEDEVKRSFCMITSFFQLGHLVFLFLSTQCMLLFLGQTETHATAHFTTGTPDFFEAGHDKTLGSARHTLNFTRAPWVILDGILTQDE